MLIWRCSMLLSSEESIHIEFTVVWAHVIALITKQMSTTDGAIDQKLIYDLEWIYYCLLPKAVMQMKHLPSAKFYLSLSAQIKHT